MDGKSDPVAEGLSEAVRLLGRGDLKGAMDKSALLLRADPQCAPALAMMGIVAMRMGDQGLALNFIERAHQNEPDYREYPALLAYLCATVGRVTDALYYAKLAAVLAPHRLSALLSPPGLPAGKSVFDNIDVSAHWFLAEAAFHSGKFLDAALAAEAELRVNPENYQSLVTLARSRQALGQFDVARGHLLAATRLQPDGALALRYLGDVLLDLGEHEQALANHRASLTLELADDAAAATHVLAQLPWYRPMPELAAELAAHANPPRRPPVIETPTHYLGIAWDQCFVGPAVDFVLPVLEHLKDVVLYRLNRRTDGMTEVARAKAMRFHDCADLDPATLDRLISGDGPRALINLCSSLEDARFPVLGGLALAPVVQWLGLPMPDRLPGADLVIGAPVTRAADLAVFDEDQVVTLPQLLAWRFPATGAEAETVGPLPRDTARDGQVTFGVTGDLRRITPDAVALWAGVLRAVPGAVLLIGNANGVWSKPVSERLGQMFANFGVVERVRLQGPHQSGAVNLDLMARIDILLDSAPVTGMNDVAEALWMGVPVVTLKGERRAGCVGAAILDAASRPDWIAASADDYVATAAALAAAPDLAATRTGLRDSVAGSPLCDATGFARMLIESLEARLSRAADAA